MCEKVFVKHTKLPVGTQKVTFASRIIRNLIQQLLSILGPGANNMELKVTPAFSDYSVLQKVKNYKKH